MAERLLVVDDDAAIRETLADVLARQGLDVDQAGDGETALGHARRRRYDLVLLDMRLPDANGLDILARIRDADDGALVVMMTAYPEVRTAVTALKAGAYDYLNKPFDLEDVKELVRRALETQRLRKEVERLRARAGEPAGLADLIGRSTAFRGMVEVTKRVAAAGRTPVLIRGESGTGKERIAQAIHNLSPRAAGPWVTLNCSAIAEGLLESEMFGHEKGAFTDAKSGKRGLLELADAGTLFLDEIGDLAIALQPKLLRAIETQAFRRVGGQREIRVDVRFVAATNRDLATMVRAGRFREDLYYRLNVAGIDVPPLRERRGDILPLARHFLVAAATTMGVPPAALGAGVPELLEAYDWPGNVRELRNVIERAVILASDGAVGPAHLPKEILARAADPAAGVADEWLTLEQLERRHIRAVLERCGGNKTRAARELGISRVTLRAKARQYGLAEFVEEPAAGPSLESS
jgi:DNA-binding NtrC family response regulator